MQKRGLDADFFAEAAKHQQKHEGNRWWQLMEQHTQLTISVRDTHRGSEAPETAIYRRLSRAWQRTSLATMQLIKVNKGTGRFSK